MASACALAIFSGKIIFICSFETPAEFGGAKPRHLLTQTTPLLESPTGAFIAAQPQPFRNYFFTGGVVEGNGSCRAAFCESAARRGSTADLHPLSQNVTVLPAPSGREPLAWRESFLLHLDFNSGANGVRPLRLCFANPPLPKGEARALPKTFSLHLKL